MAVLSRVDRQTGREDRLITRTPAQVAREVRAERIVVDRIVALEKPGERRDKPRRAKPALRPMAVDHRLLDRAESPWGSDSLNRDDVRTIEPMERLNARDEGPIAKGRTRSGAGQDRACPAITLGAADLGANQAPLPEIFDQRQKNGISGDQMPFTVHVNEYTIPHTIPTLEQRARSRKRLDLVITIGWGRGRPFLSARRRWPIGRM